MEPEVKLVTWTPNPIGVMSWAFMNMHKEISPEIPKLSDAKQVDFLKMIKLVPHKTVMEFVNMVWYFGNVTRAFQQQLTRTRQASYSIQSLRIVKKNLKRDFKVPDRIGRSATASELQDDALDHLSDLMSQLEAFGIPTEDVRAYLPLNITSPITMSINLRSLDHLLEQRLCENTQGEFRQVANMMVKEMKSKMHPMIDILFGPPCRVGKCHSTAPCGKVPAAPYGHIVKDYLEGKSCQSQL